MLTGKDTLLCLVFAIKALVSIWKVRSDEQLKLQVWDVGDNKKAPAFSFCLTKKSTFNHSESI